MKDKKTFQLLKLGVVANTFEWYEHIIYVYLASYLGQLFFNETSAMAGMIKSFSLIAFANLIRPIGGFFFGTLSDHTSRKTAVTWALIMMAIPTVLIGVLPTYADIGLAAPILLCLLRLIQGFSMGGEFPSNVCYILENTSPKHKNILSSLLPASPTIGVLLGSSVITLLFWGFDKETLMAWAWRIPFLLGVPLALCIRYVRGAFDIIPASHPDKDDRSKNKLKATSFFKENRFLLPQAILLMGFGNIVTALCQGWLPFYLTHFLHYAPEKAQLFNVISLISSLLFYIGTGYAANFLGSKKVLIGVICSSVLFILPLFLMLQLGSNKMSIIAHILFSALISGHGGVIFRILGELFPRDSRGRGLGLAWDIPLPLLGGTAPLLCAYGIEKTGMLMFPAFYIMAYSVLIIPLALKLPSWSKVVN